MRCKYCRNRFDGRKHHCPRCGKHRHYVGPAQRRRYRSLTSTTASMAIAVMYPLLTTYEAAIEARRKAGHAEAKEKLEELE